jgi:hypothetical protein
MIAQGTNGLSRADYSEGVMRGIDMQAFVPLHLNALEREPKLKPWLQEVTAGLDATFLPLEGWFLNGHGAGTNIWTPPPPAMGDVVVEQLGWARLVRHKGMHIVAIPWLMMGWWRRHLTRGTDFYFKVDWSDVWELEDQFEPLLIIVCLPYKSCSPNFGKQNSLLEEFHRNLLSKGVPKESPVRRRNILRKMFLQVWALSPM